MKDYEEEDYNDTEHFTFSLTSVERLNKGQSTEQMYEELTAKYKEKK